MHVDGHAFSCRHQACVCMSQSESRVTQSIKVNRLSLLASPMESQNRCRAALLEKLASSCQRRKENDYATSSLLRLQVHEVKVIGCPVVLRITRRGM